jgi:hypothetical protein
VNDVRWSHRRSEGDPTRPNACVSPSAALTCWNYHEHIYRAKYVPFLGLLHQACVLYFVQLRIVQGHVMGVVGDLMGVSTSTCCGSTHHARRVHQPPPFACHAPE